MARGTFETPPSMIPQSRLLLQTQRKKRVGRRSHISRVRTGRWRLDLPNCCEHGQTARQENFTKNKRVMRIHSQAGGAFIAWWVYPTMS